MIDAAKIKMSHFDKDDKPLDGALMLKNVNEVIEEKGKRVERLHEELEICKVVIQDKINEVLQLQEEISLLEEFLPSVGA